MNTLARPPLSIVIPTLGDRVSMLQQCIDSVLACGASEIVVVSPNGRVDVSAFERRGGTSIVQLSEKPGIQGGAAAAINIGLKYVIDNSNTGYVGWIGDDDELLPGGIEETLAILEANPDSPAAVGSCEIVDEKGSHILYIKPKRRDVLFFGYKGNKLPQPGSIFSITALRSVGLLDTSLRYAFDQDLTHRLLRYGPLSLNTKVVAKFRWHSKSLSSSGSLESLRESIQTRLRYSFGVLALIVIIHGYVAKLAHRLNLTQLP